MDFEELLQRVNARVERYDGPGAAEVVLGGAAEAEAEALWGAAQPADPERVTPQEGERFAAARLVLGWFAYCRHTALGPGLPAVVELAKAVMMFTPAPQASAAIPLPLRPMVGAAADPAVQADTGTRMLLATAHTDDWNVVQAAAVLLGLALGRLPAEHPDWARYTANFGLASLQVYERDGSPVDLDLAVEAIGSAISAGAGHPDRPGWLSNLAGVHQRRYEVAGEVADLHRQVEVLGEALAGGHFDEPGVLGMLGAAHRNLYERSQALADLDHAVAHYEGSLAVTPDGDPALPDRLSVLGVVRLERWEHAGAERDLDLGIEVLAAAVESAPEGHPGRPGWLSNLGIAHRKRYRLGGDLVDLDRAIELIESAVVVSPGRDERLMLLSNLGLAYRARFDRGGVVADLDSGIRFAAAASRETPEGSREWPTAVANLAALHVSRFEHGGDEADADEAIRLLHSAAAVGDHPGRAGFLYSLGVQYESRYGRAGVPADLDRALAVFRQALAVTPAGHAGRATLLARLGQVYVLAYEAGDPSVTRVLLRDLAGEVRVSVTASPADQVAANRAVGELAYAMGEHGIAVRSLDAAVALLPSVAPRAGWADQDRRFGEYAGLVAEAVAAHCEVGDPVGAVEVAEHGRGVLLASRLDGSGEVTALREAHPELAGRFLRVRDDLAFSESSDQTDSRRLLWSRYEEVVAEVRACEGFEHFLVGPRLADLRPVGDGGGVVVLLNVGSRRCDALVVGAGGAPVVVPLPALSRAGAEERAEELLGAQRDTGGAERRQRVIAEHLEWSWAAIVGPVLDALPEGTSRVWWLPTGVLGFFPLHAAGTAGEPGALDRVVSSYAPTLRALERARAQPPARTREQVAVAVARTPDLPDLPGAHGEAADLGARHPGATLLVDAEATAAAVLAALGKATWAHLACHARADLESPAGSGLSLVDGVLPVPEVSRLRRSDAELAYLSACSTVPGGTRHADECLHLASAFQVAGFRHVVAGLWGLNERIAAYAAQAFYHHLPDSPAADGAAVALHTVTRTLRAQYPKRPDLWASLVHSGP